MSFCTGCSGPLKVPASKDRDHAYIAYWPPPQGSHELRLAVKDNIDMKGLVTTAGSEFRRKNSPPAEHDAKCLELARRRSVVIVGKTNLSEFALRASGMNEYYGTPRNPLGAGLVPGGSSCGSAVAVAKGTADVAFGTDTCGSIRVPAACCGVAGLKTTFGLISTKGIFPISPTHMDTVGPLARDVSGLVQGMDLLQEGFAGKYRAAVAAKPLAKNIRVGRLYLTGTDPAIDQAVDEAIAAAGFQVVKLVKEFGTKWSKAEDDGQTLARVDAWKNDGKYLDQKGVQRVTTRIIFAGKIASEEKYSDALTDQTEFKARLRETFKKVDFIVLPTLQSVPLKKPWLGANLVFELRVLGLQNTEPMNLVGNPALVLPIPLKGRSVPVTSLQLVGRNRNEAELLNAGRLVESGLRRAQKS